MSKIFPDDAKVILKHTIIRDGTAYTTCAKCNRQFKAQYRRMSPKSNTWYNQPRCSPCRRYPTKSK